MSDIELKLHVSRITCSENPVYLVGSLTDGAHVIVIAKLHTEVRGALADFCEPPPEGLEIICGNVALRFCVNSLEVQTSRIVRVLSVRGMFRNLSGLIGFNTNISA